MVGNKSSKHLFWRQTVKVAPKSFLTMDIEAMAYRQRASI